MSKINHGEWQILSTFFAYSRRSFVQRFMHGASQILILPFHTIVVNILYHPGFLPVVLYEMKFMGVFQERDLGIKRIGKSACRRQVTGHTLRI